MTNAMVEIKVDVFLLQSVLAVNGHCSRPGRLHQEGPERTPHTVSSVWGGLLRYRSLLRGHAPQDVNDV